MRLKTDALVSEFNERYRTAMLTPPRSSAPHTPSMTSSKSNTTRSTVVRFPISSPFNDITGGATAHPLSHAPPKNVSPTPTRVQHAPAPPAALSAASTDFVYSSPFPRVTERVLPLPCFCFARSNLPRYYRAMLSQAQAETSQAREALSLRDLQLSQANALNGELRTAIALRDGCLEHANSAVAQLQQHKLHLYTIIDSFRAQQAASKSQLDLQARALISKERHIFSLNERIQRLQTEFAHHQSSCEEALQFMLHECKSVSCDRDAAMRELVSLRHQVTHSKALQSNAACGGIGSSARKAMLASLDVGPRLEHCHPITTNLSARDASASSAGAAARHGNLHSTPQNDSHRVESPAPDRVIDFYLAHSHKKQPFAAMFGALAAPADGAHHDSAFDSSKTLLHLFGDLCSSSSSQHSDEDRDSDVIDAHALELNSAERNSHLSKSSGHHGSSRSTPTPTAQQLGSASMSKASAASSSTGKEPRVFVNQHRRRAAARSLAGNRLSPTHRTPVRTWYMKKCCKIQPPCSHRIRPLSFLLHILAFPPVTFVFRHVGSVSARKRRSQPPRNSSAVRFPPCRVPAPHSKHLTFSSF